MRQIEIAEALWTGFYGLPTFTRRLVERITVVDGETIRVKLRNVEMEIEQRLC